MGGGEVRGHWWEKFVGVTGVGHWWGSMVGVTGGGNGGWWEEGK